MARLEHIDGEVIYHNYGGAKRFFAILDNDVYVLRTFPAPTHYELLKESERKEWDGNCNG
jgi:hypothetical protein